VFISPSWETHFPMASLSAETRIGFDHTPLILDSGEGLLRRSNRFFFETSWLALPDFKEVLQGIWNKLLISPGRRRDTIDSWHIQSAGLRHYLKGWGGANRGKLEREAKAHILAQIQSLDVQADASGMDEDEWALRYHLEDELMQILCVEEEYWRQRGRQNWLLHGDANTAYFHTIANGRHRKCAIRSLQSEEGEISGPAAIQDHIYKFYMGLMGTEDPKFISMRSNCWSGEENVADVDNAALALSFSREELEEVLAGTKTATAPGPNGFPVDFFKKNWVLLKDMVFQIHNGFALGTMDVSCLNFGILSLLPKVVGADSIKQYHPIALINVILKFVAKAVANRLAPMANRIIAQSQTAFINGRLILDGALSLHEIIHELKTRKSKLSS
jgi:hypothetical protein